MAPRLAAADRRRGREVLPAPERVQPVLGPLAKRAMRIHAGGDKRRKLLVLICAYADAGEPSPAVATLAARLKLPNQAIDPLLDHLQQDGFLTVARREHHRNVYTVHLNGGSS